MKSISYYLSRPFKDGVDWADVKELKKYGKSIQKVLNDSPVVIYMTLTFPNRKLVRVNIQEKVKPIYWNFDTQSVKPNMYGSLELNDRLTTLKGEVMRRYRKTVSDNPNITLSDVKELVEKVIAGSVPDFERKPLLECLQEFINEREPQINKLTTKKYKSLVNTLELWMEECDLKPKHFFCDHVDYDFEFSFKNFLIRRDVTNNTASKYIECIKKFMRWARKKEYHNSLAFEEFEIARTRKQVIWLTDEELTKILEYVPTEKHMERTKKVFLFMLYTGQRYLDYKMMQRRHIMINSDGTMDWELYQRKGTKSTTIAIPLIKQAVDILFEFGFEKREMNDYLLPVTCNQFLNRAIKDLCEKAGIDSEITLIRTVGNQRIEQHFKKYEMISCHTARKTWVSLSMQNGLGMEYITSVTGHQNLNVLRASYLGLSEKTRREAINNAWKEKSDLNKH